AAAQRVRLGVGAHAVGALDASFQPELATGARIDRAFEAGEARVGDLLARAAATIDESLRAPDVARGLVERGAPALVGDLAIPCESDRLEGAQHVVGGAADRS